VPVKITMVDYLNYNSIKPLIQSFVQLNSYLSRSSVGLKIDTLRNKFAHEGRPISEQDQAELLPYTDFWRTFWNLQESTIFDELNVELYQLHHT
jgi:hypothetical protein